MTKALAQTTDALRYNKECDKLNSLPLGTKIMILIYRMSFFKL